MAIGHMVEPVGICVVVQSLPGAPGNKGIQTWRPIFIKPTYIFTRRVYTERDPEGYIHPTVNHSWFWVEGFYMIDFPSFCLSVFFLRFVHRSCFPTKKKKEEEKKNPVPVKM